jgi:hypothetical protein
MLRRLTREQNAPVALTALMALLELYFDPGLTDMVHASEHGFHSEILQCLSVFFPALTQLDSGLMEAAIERCFMRSIYGVHPTPPSFHLDVDQRRKVGALVVPFQDAATYWLEMLSHDLAYVDIDVSSIYLYRYVYICVSLYRYLYIGISFSLIELVTVSFTEIHDHH